MLCCFFLLLFLVVFFVFLKTCRKSMCVSKTGEFPVISIHFKGFPMSSKNVRLSWRSSHLYPTLSCHNHLTHKNKTKYAHIFWSLPCNLIFVHSPLSIYFPFVSSMMMMIFYLIWYERHKYLIRAGFDTWLCVCVCVCADKHNDYKYLNSDLQINWKITLAQHTDAKSTGNQTHIHFEESTWKCVFVWIKENVVFRRKINNKMCWV